MAQDISILVMEVQSKGIKDSTDALNNLKQAAKGAEDGARLLATANTEASEKSKSAIESLLQKMEAQVALFGKNTSESNAYKAAMKGATDAQQQHAAALGFAVDSMKSQAKATADATRDAERKAAADIRAGKEATASAEATSKAYARAQEQANRMNVAYDRQVQVMGKVQLEAMRMNAALDQAARRQSTMATDPASIERAQVQAIAMNKKLEESLAGVTRGHGSNAGAMRESMVLMHELSQGSYKRFGGSLMVLANQLDLIPKLMDKIGAASKGMQFAILGGVAAFALLGFGIIAGQMELTKFNNHLALSGNVMGVTVDSIERNAHKLSEATNVTTGAARSVLQEMAISGTVAAENMDAAGLVMTQYKRLSGDTAAEAVKHFAGMKDGVERFALEQNKTGIAVGAETIKMIHDFELQNDTVNAARVYFEAYGKSLAEEIDKADARLNVLGRTFKAFGEAATGFGHWVMNLGNAALASEQVANLDGKIKSLKESAGNAPMAKGVADEIRDAEADKAAILAEEAVRQSEATEKSRMEIEKRESARSQERFEREEKRVRGKAEKFKAMEDVIRSDGAKSHQTQEKIEEVVQLARDKWMKEHEEKGTNDSAALREVALEGIRADNLQKIHLADEAIRASKEMATKQGANEEDELRKRQALRATELEALKANYKAEMAIVNQFDNEGGHTNVEKARNKLRGKQLGTRFQNESDKISNDGKDDARGVVSREIAEQESLQKAILNTTATEQKRLEKEIQAARIRQAGVDELKSAKMDFAATEEASTAAEIESEIARRQSMIDQGDLTANEAKNEELKISRLKVQISLHKQLSGILSATADKERSLESSKRTTKDMDDSLAAAKRFEKGLVSAFGNVGKAIGGMGVSFAQMNKDMDTAANKRKLASEEDIASGKAQADFERESTSAQLNGYADMADAAKNFFDSKSRGYAIAEGVSKAFHVAELARNAISMVSNLATGASKMFAQLGPYAWPAIAAMGATMAAFGISVATSKNGGGKSAADVQKEQGTGSVFGDIGTKNSDGSTTFHDKSESISKSLDSLKSNSNIMLPVNQAMLASLRNIEASMAGLTNLIARTPGMTTGDNMGIQTGTLNRGIQGVIGGALQSIGGMVFSPILNLIAKFWGSTKQEIKDSGLQFGGSVSGLKSGSGINQYASVDTTKSSWFGLSKSTSNSVQTQGLSDELSQQFGLIFTNLEDTLKLAAPTLGKSADQIGRTIENMVITTSQVSLKGLSGTELQNAINGVISKTMDEIAQNAFPAMDDFRHVGEGYAQTVIRVASGIESASLATEQLGLKAVAYTSVQNKQGDVATEIVRQSIAVAEGMSGVNDMLKGMDGSMSELVDTYKSLVDIRKQMNGVGLNGGKLNVNTVKGAGGVSQLGSALSTYQDKYFTEQEKAAIMLKSVTADFAKLGVALPKSKQGLRDLITTAGSAGTEASDKLTGQLLALAGSYNDLYDQNTNANKTATDALNTSIDSLKKFADTLKSFKSSLLLGDLSTLTPTEKYIEAKRQYEETVTKALNGDATAQDALTGSAQAYLEASRVVNASSADYSATMNQVQADIDKMQGITDGKLTDAQAQLEVLNKQADSLDSLNMTADGIKTSLDNLLVALPAPAAVHGGVTDATAEIAKLREEQAAQAAAQAQQMQDLMAVVYDAQTKAAETIVDGTTQAAQTTAWQRKFGMDAQEER